MWTTIQKNGVRFVERAFDGKKFSVTLPEDNKQSRKQAALILMEMIDNYERSFDISRFRLSEIFEKYIKDSSATDRSIRNYENAFGKILQLLGDSEVNSLRPVMIREAFLDLPVSKSNRYTILLKMVLSWAYKMDYLENDISRKLVTRTEPGIKADISQKYLEPDELEKVLEFMKRYTEEYLLCKLMVLTGMRVGEAVAIKNDDISKDYIRVDETFDPGANEFTDPKNETSIREIYIQDELRSLLKMIKSEERIKRVAYGIRGCELILCGHDGQPLRINCLNRHLHAAESVVDKKLTSHIFRHTHVSMLAASGMSLDAISRRVGHRSPEITRDIYLHITSKQKEQDNAAIKNIHIL